MVDWSPQGLQRRVVGYHDIRMDGIHDLVLRARGASVLDVGCNRGMVGFEFANNGAKLVHGCDNFEDGIRHARETFADVRNVESKFEVVDLVPGKSALRPFGIMHYDIVLCLATVHKLNRVMTPEALSGLVIELGRRTIKYFGWRATAGDYKANDTERKQMDSWLNTAGLKCVQWSQISELGTAAIWERKS